MENFLTSEQLQHLALLLVKEKAYSGTITGDRFEDILCAVLPNCVPKRVNIRDKKWFDCAQPHRGIEAKTYQAIESRIAPGVTVRNVLKRFGPELLPEKLTIGKGRGRQVNINANPSDIGESIINYLNSSLERHAKEKGIKGRYDFAILLRNKNFTHVGYWEEPINFGSGSDYDWELGEKSVKGRNRGREIFSWYYANQRQIFYTFTAPNNVQLIDIENTKIVVLTKTEFDSLLKDAYDKGYEICKKENTTRL